MESTVSVESRKRKSIFSMDSDDEASESNIDTTRAKKPAEDFDEADIPEDFFNVDEADSSNVVNESTDDSAVEPQKLLTPAQKAKMEKNRQRALLLRQARLQKQSTSALNSSEHSVIRVNNSRLIDSGGGFLIDENDLNKEVESPKKITDHPAPILKPDRPDCDECGSEFHDSFLYRSFGHPICDSCKDTEDKHELITRTDARQEFLLKDCDIDKREPALRFILRKNPHNSRWGDMKLYLRLQVERRALEVWGSEEKLEEERQMRDDKREKSKVKKFNKEIKALRMSVRSSMYRMKEAENHRHEFGPESYDQDEDVYRRTCKTCGYVESFEKM